jgi:hypothetical protein
MFPSLYGFLNPLCLHSGNLCIMSNMRDRSSNRRKLKLHVGEVCIVNGPLAKFSESAVE